MNESMCTGDAHGSSLKEQSVGKRGTDRVNPTALFFGSFQNRHLMSSFFQ
jgi:hypothetical protein